MMARMVFGFLVVAYLWLSVNSTTIEPPPTSTGNRCPVKQLKGEKGDTGADGPAGKDGLQGAKGDPGTMGMKGEVGAAGNKGNKGSKGIPGADGYQGMDGAKGDKGNEGSCDAQCGDIKKLEAKFKKLESNYTQELVIIKQKLAFLMSWVHPLGSKENPAVSCKAIYERDRGSPSGPYYIKVNGTNLPGNMQEVYCIMTKSWNCPAGITQVLKIDGSQSTFKFSSPLWTNKAMFAPDNGKKGCDYSQTKLATYWSTPFVSICVRMRVRSSWWIQSRTIDVKANSLYDLIAPGKWTKTSLDVKNDWKRLVDRNRASLQNKCYIQGINVQTKTSAARIGILGDDQSDCSNPDSYIGVGTEGRTCGRNSGTSCGNEAGCGSDKGDQHIQTMGYIYVY